MDNKQFYHSFFFTQYCFNKPKHTDRTANNHYIAQLLHGSGKLVTDTRTVTVQTGDILYIPMGCHYHADWQPDESGVVQWNSFGFTCFPDPDNHRYLLQILHPSPIGMQVLENIGKHLSSKVENIGLLYFFLSDVLTEMEPDTSLADRTVQKALSAMRSDPHARLDVIAQRCGISQTALYNSFHKSLGITPNTMRQQILCGKAQELLETTNLSVEDISSALGFSSSSYFRKVLRSHTGKRLCNYEKKTVCNYHPYVIK